MSGGITRRQALTIGALGVGALGIGATGLVWTTVGSQTSGSGTATATSGAAGWVEPSVLESVDGVLDVTLQAAEREVEVGGASVRMLTVSTSSPAVVAKAKALPAVLSTSPICAACC